MVLGFCVYVASFFLPAVQNLYGWECAYAVLGVFTELPRHWGQSIFIVIGLLNPLVLAYLIVVVLRRGESVRLYLSAAILVCTAVTFGYLGATDHPLKIGNPMWVAGILLMLAPEAGSWRLALSRSAATGGTTRPIPPAIVTPTVPTAPLALSVLSGPYAGKNYAIAATEFWIGSQPNNHLCLSADTTVSGNHACIRSEPNRFLLFDNGSHNGTQVNGRNVGMEIVELRSGDQLSIGRSEMRIG